MFAILQCGVATVYGYIQTLPAPNIGSSVASQQGYPKQETLNEVTETNRAF